MIKYIRRLDMNRDLETIKSWYRSRNLLMPDKTAFPKLGWLIEGIAAGFLVQTDTSWAVLEPFIANPEASKEDTEESLKIILNLLANEAADLGYTSVFGFSTNMSMITKAVNQGFTIVEHDSITVWKDLT